MFSFIALLALAAPPALDSLPTPKFAASAAVASIPSPRFGDEQSSPSAVAPKAMPAPKAVASPPYRDPPGTHRHRCNTDGTIWSHATGGSHNCPTCGRLQYYHYTGPNPPTVLPKAKAEAAPLFLVPSLFRSRDNCTTST